MPKTLKYEPLSDFPGFVTTGNVVIVAGCRGASKGSEIGNSNTEKRAGTLQTP